MAKYEAKTKPTAESVDEFLENIPDDSRRADCQRIREMMEEISGQPAVVWGSNIVGFGRYHYRYATGHEGEAGAVGFAPRASSITIYIVGGFEDHEELLDRLGKHKRGKGCLYIKRLADVDEIALRELIQVSLDNAARFDEQA